MLGQCGCFYSDPKESRLWGAPRWPTGIAIADLFQFIDNIGADKQAMVVNRLEDRAQMSKFAAMRENYFDKIGLPLTGRIHELGCGTGAVCRAIASHQHT